MMTDEDQDFVDSDWSEEGLSPVKIKKVYRNKKTKQDNEQVYNTQEPLNLETSAINDATITMKYGDIL